MFKAEGKMVGISPQQIISCDTTDDDCNGGDLLTVFNYVMGAESIDGDVDYTKSSNEGCGVVVYYGSEQALTNPVYRLKVVVKLENLYLCTISLLT